MDEIAVTRGVRIRGREVSMTIKVVEFSECADRTFLFVFPDLGLQNMLTQLGDVAWYAFNWIMHEAGFQILGEIYAKQGPDVLKKREKFAEKVLAGICEEVEKVIR